MGSNLHRHVIRTALGLLMPTCGVMAQNLPLAPKAQPLPHPNLAPPSIPSPGMPLWLLLSGITLALMLAAFVLWVLFRKQALAVELPPPPLSRAQKRLQALLLECDRLPPDETAHQVSVILRDYQEGRYMVPAPYRTREELYERGDFNARGPARQRFGPIAMLCDQLAFATVPPTKEGARALIQQSLEALHQESYYVTEPAKPPPVPPRPPAVRPPPLPQEIRPPVSP